MHHEQQTETEMRDKCGRALTFALMVNKNDMSAPVQMQWTEGNQHL